MTAGFIRARSLSAALALLPFAGRPLPHAELRASDPASNSHLTTAPTRITLWFTARPQLPFSHVRLVGAAGDVALGKLAADTGNAIRADIVGAVPDGTYKVVWKTASADGHPIAGEFSFMVATNPAIPVHSAPLPVAQSAGNAQPPGAARLVRLLEFIGLLVALGVIVFIHGVLPPLAARGVHTADASQRARGLGALAAILYLIGAVSRLIQERADLGTPGDAALPAFGDILTRSSWGNGWLLGATGALLVVAGSWLAVRRVRAGIPVALTGSLAMTLAPALTGHAAAARLFVASVSIDALHVASIGAWLGTLSVVILVGIPAMARVTDGNADAAVSALVNSFHPIALLAAPLAVCAGLASSVLRLGSVSALTATRYGQVLVIKLACVLLVACFGAWNSMRSRRRLGTPQATRSIRRTALVEVLLAVLVLWVTTDLVAAPAPTELLKP